MAPVPLSQSRRPLGRHSSQIGVCEGVHLLTTVVHLLKPPYTPIIPTVTHTQCTLYIILSLTYNDNYAENRKGVWNVSNTH